MVEPKRRSFLVDLLVRLFKEKPLGAVGGVIVLAMLLIGLFADLLAPYGINESHLADRLSGPSAQYLMGTDNLGRDILSRVIHGARTSMIVAVGGVCINLVVATTIGAISGFIGGKLDLVVQRFVDAFTSFPWLLLVLTVMALVGNGLAQVTITLGVLYGFGYVRVVRGAVIGTRQSVYVEAAAAVGCSTRRMLARHILPNIAPVVVVVSTISMGYFILAEASLSFLGFGVPPPQPSWGGMLSGSGMVYMLLNPWMALWPGLALGIVVYGMNMLGDAMRDLLDPRLRGGVGRYKRVKMKTSFKRQD